MDGELTQLDADFMRQHAAVCLAVCRGRDYPAMGVIPVAGEPGSRGAGEPGSQADGAFLPPGTQR